ncbi:MAG: TetR/AcrR family transcriptional regulator [Solirubrobacteraceae bacterium]|nr:TetR/AcrR family transcriptional regulator [Solirubrobacteraceae bacterium]
MTRPASPLDELLGRALGRPAGPAADDTEHRVFDAALEVLAERGTERATMDDIAARSGVGRATLFRRFGGKDELLERALVGELRRFLDEVIDIFSRVRDPAERIAETFASLLRLGDRPFLRGTDPARTAAVAAAMTAGDPSPQQIAVRFVAAFLAEGQRTEELVPGDPEVQADAIVRLALAYLLLPGLRPEPVGDDEARRIARVVFVPLAGVR